MTNSTWDTEIEGGERVLPLHFNKTIHPGNFIAENLKIYSLKNCPEVVTGNFYVKNNHIKTLKYFPTRVEGDITLYNNQLGDLVGCPPIIYKSLRVDQNFITTLVGGPTLIDGEFDCSNNRLTNLIGAPEYIGDRFLCDENYLTTLDGLNLTRPLKSVSFINNKITSLKGIHNRIPGCFKIDISDNPIQEGGIGLILIPGLQKVLFRQTDVLDPTDFSTKKKKRSNFDRALLIIYKYLDQGKKGLLQCQEELVNAGLSEFAEL